MPIGPALPPHLQKQKDENEDIGPVLPSGVNSGPEGIGPALPSGITSEATGGSIGPAFPPGLKSGPEKAAGIGPALPPHLQAGPTPVGPSLPPHLEDDDSGPETGPTLPPQFQKTSGPSLPPAEDSDDDYGPSLPPGFGPPVKGPAMPPTRVYQSDSDSDEGPVIGPLPPSQLADQSEAFILAEFNRREERMKLKLSGVDVDGENKLEREEWMTELPSLRQVRFFLISVKNIFQKFF